MNTADKVIALAVQEVGYKEKASNSQLDSKTANAGTKNWNKYARYIDTQFPGFYNGKKNGFDWCDIFVDYLFIVAFGKEAALHLLCQPEKSLGAGCLYSAQYYEQAGRFTMGDPQPGDQIFFKDAGGDICHTGLVVNVDISRDDIAVIEGNAGNAVKYRSYHYNDRSIYGFGRPRYDKPEKPDLNRVALDVIAGKYGNGVERKTSLAAAGYNYKEIQGLVNKLLKA